MSIKYIPEKSSFRVTYKDWHLVSKGAKSPYSSKFFPILDAEGKKISKPTKKQIRDAEKSLQGKDSELESATIATPAAKQVKDSKTPKRLLLPLLKQTLENPCYSQADRARARARYALNELITYLEEKKLVGFTTDSFQKNDVLDFLKATYPHQMKNTIQGRLKRFRTAYKLLLERNRIAGINPFKEITMYDITNILEEPYLEKDGGMYMPAYMKAFYDWASERIAERGKQGVLKNPQGAKICLYCLLLTGWRVADAVSINKEQIDFCANTIRLIHSKTLTTSRAHSVLFLPRHFRCLLEETPTDEQGFYWSGKIDSKSRYLRELLNEYFTIELPAGYKEFEKNGRINKSHSLHGFRRSVITLLKGENVNNEIVNYIVGHSSQSIEEKHYNVFSADPEKYTREPLEIMENFIEKGDSAVKEMRHVRLIHYAKTLEISMIDAQAIFYAEEIALTRKRVKKNPMHNARVELLAEMIFANDISSKEITDIAMVEVIKILKDKEEKERRNPKEREEARKRIYQGESKFAIDRYLLQRAQRRD